MAKMEMICNECGKKFKAAASKVEVSCPKCKGVDVEPEYKPIIRKVVFRNYSAGPFDFLGEAA